MSQSEEASASSSPSSPQHADPESQLVPLVQDTCRPQSGTQSEQPGQLDEGSYSSRVGGGGSRISIPVGAWRDDFWDMSQHGYCHPAVCWSCCCAPIAMGQVATRLHLTWLGTGGTVSESAVTFRKLFYLVWVYWAIRAFMLYLIYLVDPNVGRVEWVAPSPAYHMVCTIDDIFSYAYIAFSAIILRNTRKHIRSKYAIPEGDHCPGGCEDICCSLWCPCFTVAQMMRHTTDYHVYGARCCTDTGLSPSAPSIL